MSKQTPKPMTAHAPASPGAKDSHERFDEDALNVPKGVSRVTFISLIGLMIVLLIIFLVPEAMLDMASGDRNPVAARFQLPDGEQVELRQSDLVTQQRTLMDAFAMDFFLAMRLGIDPSKPQPAELTRFLVLDRIARQAGVDVTDADLRAHIEQTLQFQGASSEDFRAMVRMRGLNQIAVEESIRNLLRVSRFQQLVGFSGAVPDPKKIEEQWHQENVEFAFDYVVVPVADFTDEARQALPDDAALEAWFQALDEGEQAEFRTAEKRKAEVALYRDGETTPATELLEAYPEIVPEGTEPTAPEELARQYYDRVSWKRFQKPAIEAGEGVEATPAGFFTFEEVQEQCLAEAPVFHAMQRWVDDLAARKTNGEAIDFSEEAQRLGLEHQNFLEPLSREDYAGASGADDAEIGHAVFAAAPDGSFHPMPVPTAQGLAVVRANERTEPALPAFAEMRERVVEKWIEPKAEELAKAHLASLRTGQESFEPAPPAEGAAPKPANARTSHFRATAEAFQVAAQAAGLEVKKRDYLNKANPVSAGLLSDDEERRKLTTQANAFGLYTLEADELSEPSLSPDKSSVFLVRLAGKRDVPIDDMSPAQYNRYKQSVRSRAMSEIGQGLDLDFLRANYGLWLLQDELAAQAEAAEASKPKS